LPAAAPYPVGKGNAAILRIITPKSRHVRWRNRIGNGSSPIRKLKPAPPGRIGSEKVLALYQKRSGAAHVVEVAEAAAPERF